MSALRTGSAAAGRALSVALAAMLSACAMVPPHIAAAPKPIAESQLGLTGDAFRPAPNDWWHQLGDPQLDRLMIEALRDNPRLAEANARWREAQAQAEVASSAQQPNAGFSGSDSRYKIPSDFGPYLLGGQSVWFGGLGASLSWDPDLSGEKADRSRAARGLALAADMDQADARLLLSGAVVQAYLQLDRAAALEQIASDTQAQREHIADITRRRVTAGLDTRVELREAEGEVPQAHLALLQAQDEETLATHRLAVLVGRGADFYASIQRPQLNVQNLLPLPQALPINLLVRRPDVFAARQRIAAADAGQQAVRAAFYPSVNLSALVGFASVSLSDVVNAQSFGYGAGPAVTLPIFDGGRLRAQYRGAQAELVEAVESYDDIVLGAVRDAADQITQIDSLGAQQLQQQQWLDASQEAYRLDEERYRAGLAGYLSVLNAETEVFNARRTAVELHNQRASARVALLIALGGSFEPPDPRHQAQPAATTADNAVHNNSDIGN